jgi:hypothetical protein
MKTLRVQREKRNVKFLLSETPTVSNGIPANYFLTQGYLIKYLKWYFTMGLHKMVLK